jgi:hypothetical protein
MNKSTPHQDLDWGANATPMFQIGGAKVGNLFQTTKFTQ